MRHFIASVLYTIDYKMESDFTVLQCHQRWWLWNPFKKWGL